MSKEVKELNFFERVGYTIGYNLKRLRNILIVLSIVYTVLCLSVNVSFMFPIDVVKGITEVLRVEFSEKNEIRDFFENVFTKKVSVSVNGNDEYLRVLGMRESSLNYNIVGGANNHYLGAFQFGRTALKDVGRIDSRIEYRRFRRDFIANGARFYTIEQQKEDCLKLAMNNKRYLGDYYTRYNNRTIDGVRVTQAGMLAASHLVGYQAVKNWLDSNGSNNSADANGTTVKEYVSLMENVRVNF